MYYFIEMLDGGWGRERRGRNERARGREREQERARERERGGGGCFKEELLEGNTEKHESKSS